MNNIYDIRLRFFDLVNEYLELRIIFYLYDSFVHESIQAAIKSRLNDLYTRMLAEYESIEIDYLFGTIIYKINNVNYQRIQLENAKIDFGDYDLSDECTLKSCIKNIESIKTQCEKEYQILKEYLKIA